MFEAQDLFPSRKSKAECGGMYTKVALGRDRQGGEEFQAILGYTVSLGPVWALGGPAPNKQHP